MPLICDVVADKLNRWLNRAVNSATLFPAPLFLRNLISPGVYLCTVYPSSNSFLTPGIIGFFPIPQQQRYFPDPWHPVGQFRRLQYQPPAGYNLLGDAANRLSSVDFLHKRLPFYIPVSKPFDLFK
jgi:hypothetical protein